MANFFGEYRDPPVPHDTHEFAEFSDHTRCLGCGDMGYDLEQPCPNAPCPRCSELNGTESPTCGEDHGTHYAYDPTLRAKHDTARQEITNLGELS
jgi:phage FluMu protein Com